MKDTTKPIAIRPATSLVIISRLSQKSRVNAPTMVGMARKNENSAAAFLSTPSSRPPTIVAPLRDTPGMIDRHCHRPMPSAVFHDSFMESSVRSRCSRVSTPSLTTRLRPMVPASDQRSSTIRAIPPTISVTQTMVVLNSTPLMNS